MDEIKLGKYKHYRDGSIVVVVGIAQHTEANYSLVIHHPEQTPGKWNASPTGVFTERIQTQDGSVRQWQPLPEKS